MSAILKVRPSGTAWTRDLMDHEVTEGVAGHIHL